ncbi:MAG: metal ABC transporter solute-binding protein, Zn/Mn family [Gammaproteobacteria bacterium]
MTPRTQLSITSLLCLIASLAPLPASAQTADSESPVVLTGTQATFSLTSALTASTPVQVVNVPEDGRQLTLLRDYIARRIERFEPLFKSATAVVSLTNALPGDPLYRFARDENIRVVDIEAATPWSFATSGVALTNTPVSNVPWTMETEPGSSATAPYFWLSVSNAIRMADIIGADLTELFPDSADTIEENLDELKWSLLNLRNDYQNRLIESADDAVFALTGDFVYLTNDMGLFVDGYFIKQDIHWTDSDLSALTERLTTRGIRVVLHRWLPSDSIQEAVRAAGAELVVLDTADPGIVDGDTLAVDGLQQILEGNLEAIHSALNR